jgi:hypothetical protein
MLCFHNLTWLERSILLLALVAMLVGCGGATSTPAPLQPITLRFGYYTNMAEYEPLAEIFHESHPYITVELVPAYDDGPNSALDVLDNTDLDVIRWYSSYPTPNRRAPQPQQQGPEEGFRDAEQERDIRSSRIGWQGKSKCPVRHCTPASSITGSDPRPAHNRSRSAPPTSA